MLNFEKLQLLILKVGASTFLGLGGGCCWWVANQTTFINRKKHQMMKLLVY